ncbi:MAG: Minf_1886 family protein [Pirellulales bacterium]
MSDKVHPLLELLQQDQRYHLEAYQFVREALAYSQEILQMNTDAEVNEEGENHITGQQLCEGIRQYSVQQYGYMAKTVLNTWGIFSTGDFGEIVYNLIRIKHMKKSDSDRREDFDDVYEFETAFDPQFELSGNDDSST